MIDILRYLDDVGIDSKDHGKNVGVNDTNVDCPWCGAEKHMGINKKSAKIWCWVCEFEDFGGRRSIINYICEMENCGWKEAKEILSRYSDGFHDTEPDTHSFEFATKCSWPKYTQPFNTPLQQFESERDKALAYLNDRRYGWREISKFGLRFCPWPTGGTQYGGRIMIPIVFNGEMTSFLGRDYTGRDDRDRYYNSLLSQSTMRARDQLYGYDDYSSPDKSVRIVEGAIDKWRGGDDFLGVFKSYISDTQLGLIRKLHPATLSIFFDEGAYSRAYSCGLKLSAHIRQIKVVRLVGKDPAELNRGKLLELEALTPSIVC